MFVKLAGKLAPFTLLSVLTACSQQPSFDDAAALPQIDQFVRGEPGMFETCGERFDFADFSIADKRIEGDTAQIAATFRITSRKDVHAQAMVKDICYRQPPEGWRIGQSQMVRRDFTFEKWDSGWRLVRQ